MTVSRETSGPWWVFVQGEEYQDAWVGPYESQEEAEFALDHSELVDSLCAEDSTECYVTSEQPHGGAIHTPGGDDLYDDVQVGVIQARRTLTSKRVIREVVLRAGDSLTVTLEGIHVVQP